MADLSIPTDWQLDLRPEIAGLGSRALAYLLDAIIRYGSLLLLLMTLTALDAVEWLITIHQRPLALALLILAFLLAQWGYGILFEIVWQGQTPGKRALGLRVTTLEGAPPPPGAVVARQLLRIIDFLPLGYALGTLVMFLDGLGRRVGDWASGCVVVVEGDVDLSCYDAPRETVDDGCSWRSDGCSWRSDGCSWRSELPGPEPAPAADEELQEILADFLQRRERFAPEARRALAERIVASLAGQGDGADPERRIERWVAASRP